MYMYVMYVYIYVYITGTLRGIGATQTGTDLEQLWSFSSRSREAFPLESLEVCSGSLLLCSSGLKPPIHSPQLNRQVPVESAEAWTTIFGIVAFFVVLLSDFSAFSKRQKKKRQIASKFDRGRSCSLGDPDRGSSWTRFAFIKKIQCSRRKGTQSMASWTMCNFYINHSSGMSKKNRRCLVTTFFSGNIFFPSIFAVNRWSLPGRGGEHRCLSLSFQDDAGPLGSQLCPDADFWCHKTCSLVDGNSYNRRINGC